MAVDPLLLGLLLFAAAAAGFFGARLTQRRHHGQRPVVPPAEFYRGLDHVLRDESDKAVTVLQHLAESDPDIVETHFALATLFRRRGETDRAIRIHQDLLARPKLARRHREQALLELAEDYFKAGLYDRAESLYKQLDKKGVFRTRALERLVFIYERQHDWDQAVDVRRRLADAVPGKHDDVIAHYYCEQARQAQSANDLASMRVALKQARKASKGILRSALMRADLALLRDDQALAQRLYRRALEENPGMAAVIVPRLSASVGDDAGALSNLLKNAVRRNPGLGPDLGKAALATGALDDEMSTAAVRDLLRQDPALGQLASSDLEQAIAVLKGLGLGRLEYLCQQCGYRARELNWQCPACQAWDTARPDIRTRARELRQ